MLQINQLRKSNSQDDNPGFERPLSLLRSCHQKIMHFSSSLYKLTQMLPESGWTPSLESSADQIRHYFNVAGPEHHKDEEEHLFPAIIALDPQCKKAQTRELIQLINTMIKEHVESDVLWEQLDTLLLERTDDYTTLKQLAGQFAQDMQQHAEIENEQIFPFAEEHISKQQFRLMGQDIAQRRGVKYNSLL